VGKTRSLVQGAMGIFGVGLITLWIISSLAGPMKTTRPHIPVPA
jgi:hypothetical protein